MSGIRVPAPFVPPFRVVYKLGDTVVDSRGNELVCFDLLNGMELAEFVKRCINRALATAPPKDGEGR